MKITKKVTQVTTVEGEKPESKTWERVVSVTCDLCGKTGEDGFESSRWPEVNETELEVTVKHKTGENYGDCGTETIVSVDICPACFQTKLIPWLKSQGAQIQEETVDF